VNARTRSDLAGLRKKRAYDIDEGISGVASQSRSHPRAARCQTIPKALVSVLTATQHTMIDMSVFLLLTTCPGRAHRENGHPLVFKHG
jgi:hypothetical protein